MGIVSCSFCATKPPVDYPETLTLRHSFSPAYSDKIFPLLKEKSQGSFSTQISLKNTDISLSDFTFIKLLGSGASGRIFLVQKKSSSNYYAMKAMKKQEISKKKHQEYAFNELKILQKNECPYICSLKYSFQTQDFLYLAMDFLAGGDLFFHLRQENAFPEEKARRYTCEILCALEYLHENGVIYRDLKPENVLFDSKGHVRLVDFGLAKCCDGRGNSLVGTPEYVAPEVLLKKKYDFAVDYWNLGCVLFEMLVGRPPFVEKNLHEVLKSIVNKELELPSGLSKEAGEVLNGLLEKDPKKRLRAPALKKLGFFEGIDWEIIRKGEGTVPFVPELENELDLRYFEKKYVEDEVIWKEDEEASSQNLYEYYMNFSYKHRMESVGEREN